METRLLSKTKILFIKAKMIYIITPCSRPQNLEAIYQSLPKASDIHWILCSDHNNKLPTFNNSTNMVCDDTGIVGTKARNYVLDNFNFGDEDHILFHDDDNVVHPDLYINIKPHLEEDFSILSWGQLNKDNSVRLLPTSHMYSGYVDTASFLIKWKHNKAIRHKTDRYDHDGIYAYECSQNGKVIVLDSYLCYYNYLR